MRGLKMLAASTTALWLAACGGTSGGGSTGNGTYTLRLATWGSTKHPQVTGFVPLFTKLVEQNSKGRIKVQYYPGASLVKEQEVSTAIPNGTADIALTPLTQWVGLAPELGMLGTPLVNFTFDGYAKAVHPGTSLFKAINAIYEKHGAILLSTEDIGPTVFVSKVSLDKPSDFKGKNIRVYDKPTGELVRALGAAPTQLSVNDVYAALSNGTVIAAYGGLQGAYGLKEYEVTKYLVYPQGKLGDGMNGYVMNQRRFQSLPADLQKVVLDAATQADSNANKALKDNYAKTLHQMQKHGLTIEKIDASEPDWTSALAPYMQKQKDRFKNYPLLKTLQDAEAKASQ